MRLYDEINRYGLVQTNQASEIIAEDFRNMLRHAQVVDVTNVQEYLRASASLRQDPFDMPNVAPQFPTTFYEFWTGHEGMAKGTRIGLLIASWDREKDPDGDDSDIPLWVRSRDRWEFRGEVRDMSDSRWMLWGLEVSTGGNYLPRNVIQGPSCSFSIEVGHDGRVVRFKDGIEPVAGANFMDDLHEVRVDIDVKALNQLRWGGLKFSLLPCLFASSLMHCKNAEMHENVPDQKLSRAFYRRSGHQMTRYYTLTVGPVGSKKSTGSAHNGPKIAKSLHICRGHFSTYTEDRPLFGKYSGQFWIPSHVRGTTEVGAIVKDYSVKAPSEAA